MLIKDKKQLTVGSKVLIALLKADYYYGRLSDRARFQGAFYPEYTKYKARSNLDSLLYKLEKRGKIRYTYSEGERIVKLTKKGQLEALLACMYIHADGPWDGRWRLVVFDIPERARGIRDRLRNLLVQVGFKPLQASVYISPYPLSREAAEYLDKSGLIRYIRILRVDRIDNAADLYRIFNIKQKIG